MGPAPPAERQQGGWNSPPQFSVLFAVSSGVSLGWTLDGRTACVVFCAAEVGAGFAAFDDVTGGTTFAGVVAFGLGLGVALGADGTTADDGNGEADVVAPTAGRGTGGAAGRSWNDEIQAVMPAISTTTTMLMPTSGARLRA